MTDQKYWQPIATAPKDGREVLGCACREFDNGDDVKLGPWTMKYDKYYLKRWVTSWNNNEVVAWVYIHNEVEYKILYMQPTHWAPLPDLPKLTSAVND